VGPPEVILELSLCASSACEKAEQCQDDEDYENDPQDADDAPPFDVTRIVPSISAVNLRSFVGAVAVVPDQLSE
jgi:hypothetical protein